MATYDGPIIDVDVHHCPRSDAELMPYLPARWRSYVNPSGREVLKLRPPTQSSGRISTNGNRRRDSYPPEGGPPGSSYDMTRRQLLESAGFAKALLTFDLGDYASHLNPFFATALCRAANNWNIDTWLAIDDDRIVSVVTVPSAAPLEAAEEIRRCATHPKIVGVLLAGNAAGRPFGDPLYHPIYEAAQEAGLVIVIHPGNDRPNVSVDHAGGSVMTGLEYVSLYSQQAEHYLSSFVVHGVFEKFPQLRVQITEYGLAWLPSFLWRLDDAYQAMRAESPWVMRRPSEYIFEHVTFSTQPLDDSPKRDGIARLLGAVEGIEDILCFSTDYPHWSSDEPTYVARRLPAAWHEKVFVGNACRTYGFEGITHPRDRPVAAAARP